MNFIEGEDFSIRGTLNGIVDEFTQRRRVLPENLIGDLRNPDFGVVYAMLTRANYYDDSIAMMLVANMFQAVCHIMRQELYHVSPDDQRYTQEERNAMVQSVYEFSHRMENVRKLAAGLSKSDLLVPVSKANYAEIVLSFINECMHECNQGLIYFYDIVGAHVLNSHHPFEFFRRLFIMACSLGNLNCNPSIIAGLNGPRFRQEMPQPDDIYLSHVSIGTRMLAACQATFTMSIECCTNAIQLGWHPNLAACDVPEWREYVETIKEIVVSAVVAAATRRTKLALLMQGLKAAKEEWERDNLERLQANLEEALFLDL